MSIAEHELRLISELNLTKSSKQGLLFLFNLLRSLIHELTCMYAKCFSILFAKLELPLTNYYHNTSFE